MKLRRFFLTLVVSIFTTLLIAGESVASRTDYTMVKSDYQIIVDYVNTNLANTQKYPATAEDYFGASAYYSNFDARSSAYDDAFANSDSAIAEGLSTVFLPTKFATALVSDTFVVNYTVYNGSSSDQFMTFVCTGLMPLAFAMIESAEVVVVPLDFSDLSFGTDSTFDVMTWNIEHFPKNGDVTMENVKDALRALQPEVVAFQEIDDTAKFREMIDGLEGYEPIIGFYGYAPMCFAYKSDSVTVNSTEQLFEDDWRGFPREPFVLDATYRGEDFIIISNHLKCCGDGTLDVNNLDDEENRRFNAIKTLKSHIDATWVDENVIVVGDFNDVLEDAYADNVFMPFINDSVNYVFSDMSISYGNSADFSYPSWPSHLDHILITNELFGRSTAEVIKVDDAIGWTAYDADISDHRPVGLRVMMGDTTTTPTFLYEAVGGSISINPNPIESSLNIEGLSEGASSSITLFNNSGKELQTLVSKGEVTLSIDMSAYSSGVYVLLVQEGTERFCSKVIKK